MGPMPCCGDDDGAGIGAGVQRVKPNTVPGGRNEAT